MALASLQEKFGIEIQLNTDECGVRIDLVNTRKRDYETIRVLYPHELRKSAGQMTGTWKLNRPASCHDSDHQNNME